MAWEALKDDFVRVGDVDVVEVGHAQRFRVSRVESPTRGVFFELAFDVRDRGDWTPKRNIRIGRDALRRMGEALLACADEFGV